MVVNSCEPQKAFKNQLEKLADAEGGVYRQTVVFQADETIAAHVGDQTMSLPLREIFVSTAGVPGR